MHVPTCMCSTKFILTEGNYITTNRKLQGVRLPDADYCNYCTHRMIDGELSGIKDRLNELLKATNIGARVKYPFLLSI